MLSWIQHSLWLSPKMWHATLLAVKLRVRVIKFHHAHNAAVKIKCHIFSCTHTLTHSSALAVEADAETPMRKYLLRKGLPLKV